MSDEQKSNLPAVRASQFLALTGDPKGLIETMQQNVGGGKLSEFDLDRIKVPAGGGLSWEVPGLETTQAPHVDGVVVLWRDPRAFWEKGFEESGGGTPPDCSSPDGVVGVGNPGGPCASCPHSQWGSKEDGRGQACKQMRLLLMLREGDMLPVAVVAPPTSLGPLRKLFLRLVSKNVPYWSVVLRLGLVKEKSAGNFTYSKIVPSVIGRLDEQASAAARAYGEAMAPAFAAVQVDRRDVEHAE